MNEGRVRQYLSKYRNPENALRQIRSAVIQYSTLIPQQDTYVFNDGLPMQLVNLNGTIPVTYRGSVYNIPVCIWLPDTLPNNAPICYVKPTADMCIKPSIYVDQNGKIYLPYLHEWNQSSSDLVGLIQIMIMTFSEQPPVFAKTKEADIPYPSNSFMPMPGYPPSTSTSSYYPPPPPPPNLSYHKQHELPPGLSNLPYPPSSMPGSSYPMVQPVQIPPPYPIPGGGGGYNNGGASGPAQPPMNTGTIKDEHIRDSLLTAIEEKLMRLMKEQYQQNQAELETLKRTQEELLQGKTKLNNMIARLEKEKTDLDRGILLLKDKEQELDKAIERLDNEEPIDVDDAITTTAPLYKQLLNAFAEEAALEDAIYYIGEAQRLSVIDLDVFLRQIRTLSRKQFMLRALMQKCRQKAGLSV